MPLFEYKGFDPSGKSVGGLINAETSAEARKKVRVQQIFVATIDTVHDFPVQQRPGFTGWQAIFKTKLGLQDRISLFRQLATLLESGMQLVNALDVIVSSLPPKAPLGPAVMRLKDRLTEGQSFSQALAADSEKFPLVLVQMVAMGEQSGRLADLLEDYADLLEKKAQASQQLQQTLAYPIFLTLFGLAVTLFLLRVVVPKMAMLFTQNDRLLPISTRIMLSTSDFLSHHFGLLVSVVAGIGVLLVFLKQVRGVDALMDRTLFQIGVLRRLYQLLITSRLTQLWSTMLKSGLSLPVVLDLSVMTIGNRHLRHLLKQSIDELKAGGRLSSALGKRSIFPPMAVQMIEVGERSGNLVIMLQRVAIYYRKQWERRLASITTMLGPLLIVLLGGLVGFVVVSVCLPIFELNQFVGSGS